MVPIFALPFGNIDATKYMPLAYRENVGLAVFIRNVVTSFFLVAGLVTFAYLLMGGFRYLTAGGDVKATEAAMKIITNAVIGLAIIMAAYGISRILATVFGIDIFAPRFVGP